MKNIIAIIMILSMSKLMGMEYDRPLLKLVGDLSVHIPFKVMTVDDPDVTVMTFDSIEAMAFACRKFQEFGLGLVGKDDGILCSISTGIGERYDGFKLSASNRLKGYTEYMLIKNVSDDTGIRIIIIDILRLNGGVGGSGNEDSHEK
jgi:hypothetical protein